MDQRRLRGLNRLVHRYNTSWDHLRLGSLKWRDKCLRMRSHRHLRLPRQLLSRVRSIYRYLPRCCTALQPYISYTLIAKACLALRYSDRLGSVLDRPVRPHDLRPMAPGIFEREGLLAPPFLRTTRPRRHLIKLILRNLRIPLYALIHRRKSKSVAALCPHVARTVPATHTLRHTDLIASARHNRSYLARGALLLVLRAGDASPYPADVDVRQLRRRLGLLGPNRARLIADVACSGFGDSHGP